MAIINRRPDPGGIVHADHGVEFSSWAFGDKIRSAGLMPSFGSVGDGLDNGTELTARAMIDWCRFARIETTFIDPGSPWQNGYSESFNGRFRDEFLTTE